MVMLGYNDSEGWCEVRKANGDSGWVPSNYVAHINSFDKFSWYVPTLRLRQSGTS